MKNLMKLVNESKAVLDSLNIPYDKNLIFKLNGRAKKMWGQYRFSPSGRCSIEISTRLLDENVSDIATKNTIIHELIHSAAPFDGHKGKWKAYANIVNRNYPEYKIKRTTSSEEKGIANQEIKMAKYIIKCEKCGYEIGYSRMCKTVQSPERYIHKNCGGTFKRYK